MSGWEVEPLPLVVFAVYLAALTAATIWSAIYLRLRSYHRNLGRRLFANPGVRWMTIIILVGFVVFFGTKQIFISAGCAGGLNNKTECVAWLGDGAGELAFGIWLLFLIFGKQLAIISIPLAIGFEVFVRFRPRMVK